MKNERISYIDNLKALAILLVVLGHTGLDSQSTAISYIQTWIYEFHMPLFFLLSGFSFSLVLNKGNKSVLKQILNIALIYIIQSIVYILLNIGMHQFFNIQTQSIVKLSNLYTFFIYPIAHFWYLQALIIIYLVEWALNLCIKNNKIKLLIVFLISIVGMFTSFGNLSNAMYELLYFECGRQIINVNKVPIRIACLGLITSFAMPFISISNIYIENIIAIFVALSMSIFLVSLFFKHFDSKYKYITSIGTNCLWIYIFHTYFTSLTRNICGKFIPTLPIISMIIVTLIGIAGPLLTMYIFKKIKIDKIVTKPISYIWK